MLKKIIFFEGSRCNIEADEVEDEEEDEAVDMDCDEEEEDEYMPLTEEEEPEMGPSTVDPVIEAGGGEKGPEAVETAEDKGIALPASTGCVGDLDIKGTNASCSLKFARPSSIWSSPKPHPPDA